MREFALKDRVHAATIVRKLVAQALQTGRSVAMWRLPESTTTHVLACEKPVALSDIALEELPPGFLVGAFDRPEEKFFFPNELHFCLQEEALQIIKGPPDLIPEALPDQPFQWHIRNAVGWKETSAAEFADYVQAGVRAIEAGRLEKIVPSRIKDVAVNPALDLNGLFESLAERYPHALISLVSSPETGTWLGATPEILVSQNRQGLFRTVALAGTQPFIAGSDLKKTTWTQKDIEEQAFVSRYIINCFKKIRLREYEEHGPRTFRAGNLLHLKTDYLVDTRATHFPQLASVMLNLLHPTSAVCGMPLEPAREFLRAHERHQRELYTGFLGPIDVAESTDIFVNLRCMQWLGNRARLYAGAGVTADSDPTAEWNETEMKLNTILKAIQA
jgi:isochorismate synthase